MYDNRCKPGIIMEEVGGDAEINMDVIVMTYVQLGTENAKRIAT